MDVPPSPKSQSHVTVPFVTDEFVNVIVSGALHATGCECENIAVTPGVTLISAGLLILLVHPLSLVICKVTENNPEDVYTATGLCADEILPLPKSQFQPASVLPVPAVD